MKKMLMLTPALLMAAASTLHAQANPRGEAKLELDGQAISVEYGRPSLKGRDMLGQAGVGQVWRMGADGATKLVTSAPLHFGDAEVPAGEHVLRAKKASADTWHLVVVGEGESTQEVPFTMSEGSESVEQFTVALEAKGDSAGDLVLSWGKAVLRTPFSLKK